MHKDRIKIENLSSSILAFKDITSLEKNWKESSNKSRIEDLKRAKKERIIKVMEDIKKCIERKELLKEYQQNAKLLWDGKS